jgi:hypothetical protein
VVVEPKIVHVTNRRFGVTKLVKIDSGAEACTDRHTLYIQYCKNVIFLYYDTLKECVLCVYILYISI